MKMGFVTVEEWKHVPAGTEVDDGFGGTQTAPSEPGYYTLYERVFIDANTHAGWAWQKEES